MLSKLLITAMTAVILAVVCFPASAHNGRISNLVNDPVVDEQPWGGDSQYSGSELPQFSYPDIGKFQGTYFFIKLTLDHGWFSVRNYFLDVFSGSESGTVNTTAQPIQATPTETQNTDSGAGIR
jgi:hypothetical protein